MRIAEEAQALANKYASAIKRIRIIGTEGKDLCIVTPQENVRLTPAIMGEYQQDFDTFTNTHSDVIQEVRVILNNEAGASQFFPAGTAEEVIWKSVVTKEEMSG